MPHLSGVRSRRYLPTAHQHSKGWKVSGDPLAPYAGNEVKQRKQRGF